MLHIFCARGMMQSAENHREVNIMSFFTDHRELYLFDRTCKQMESVKDYALNHPVQASVAVAVLIVATVYFPVPVILALAVGILTLLAFNAFKEPSLPEDIRMQVDYNFN